MFNARTFTAHETIKMRAYPDDPQTVLFYKTIGCRRLYWNCMHEDHEYLYWNDGLNITPRPAEYKEEFPFMKEVDSYALMNTQLDYSHSWQQHFDHPNQFGTPNWKRKRDEKRGTCSYETNNRIQKRKDGSIYETIRFVDARHLVLPKMGAIEVVRHRTPPKNGVLKTATFMREADGRFYICLVYEIQITCCDYGILDVPADMILALDMSCPSFYVDQDGHTPLDDDFDMEKYPKQELIDLEKRIQRKQHELSRKEYGSANYEKFLTTEVNTLWARYRHRKEDFLQKLSTEIANRYTVVIVEDLNLKAMGNHGFHLGTSVYRNSYSTFLTLLKYKLERNGGCLLKVSRWFPSSKRCSECGHVNADLKLSDRVYMCPECGHVIDRDVNAARNLWVEGVRVLCEAVGLKLSDDLLSFGSLRSSWDGIISFVTGGAPGFACGVEQRPLERLVMVNGFSNLEASPECSDRVSGFDEEAGIKEAAASGGERAA